MSNIKTDGITIPNVAGSIDGKVPVYNPDGRFQTWRLDQIWLDGKYGENRYVPNTGDLVVDLEERSWWQVSAINEVTLKPTLKPFDTSFNQTTTNKDELITWNGPGRAYDTFRVYIDKSVRPYTMAVDPRLMVHGKDWGYVQICKGNQEDGTFKVISGLYDQSGTYLGTRLPLDLANMRDHTNFCTKTIPVCVTNEELEDNDIVYAYVYTNEGGFVCKIPLLVENTGFVNLTDRQYEYVTNIALETPFLSSSDPNVIEYPLNVPLRGLNLFGVVYYNSGRSVRLPVDGTKFQIHGFESFIASTVGEHIPLVLQYNFDSNEFHYGSSVTTQRVMTQEYTAIAKKEEGSYTVKLFCYPVWVDELTGYRLEFFMYNLDRRTWLKVTPHVTFNSNMPAFQPKMIGVTQQISVSLDLKKVNPAFKSWKHTQVIEITLNRYGNDHSDSPWTVGYERLQTPYGVGNWAEVTHENANLKRVNVTCHETTQAGWLDRVYWSTKPLYSTYSETKAPIPTHFSVETKRGSYEFLLEKWNTDLTINGVIDANETVYLRFFKRTGEGDLHLAIAGLPVQLMNTANG